MDDGLAEWEGTMEPENGVCRVPLTAIRRQTMAPAYAQNKVPVDMGAKFANFLLHGGQKR